MYKYSQNKHFGRIQFRNRKGAKRDLHLIFDECLMIFDYRTYYTMPPETLAETIESGPRCITNLFQNKFVAYF